MSINDDCERDWEREDNAEENYVRTLNAREYAIYAYANAAKWQHTAGLPYFTRQIKAHQFAVLVVDEYRKARDWAANVRAQQNVIVFDHAFDADYRTVKGLVAA